MRGTFKLVGLDCANCAAKIERAVQNLDGVSFASVDFLSAKMVIEGEENRFEQIVHAMDTIVRKHEPSVVVERLNKPIMHNIERRNWVRIAVGAAVYALGLFFHGQYSWVALGLFLAAFIVIGGDILLQAVRNILRGQVFDENLLMSIASIGAFAIGAYEEGVAVMLFYQVGELFQHHAVDKSRRSIASLMNIRPDYANVQREGTLEQVHPSNVRIGERIVIRAGERIPLDAEVLEGSSAIDTSALTGESVPREVAPGDSLLSGCINLIGLLVARVSKEFGESTASRILELVETASSKKSHVENFITRFARYYTPGVVVAAALLASVPPLILPGAVFSDWLYRALVFLVISCPCALVLSIPLSFFGGIGGASRNGILVKGGNYLEALAQAEVVVFDKTGTLTKGVFRVQGLFPQGGIPEQELLELATYAQSYSSHPIARSLVEAYGKAVERERILRVEEIAGQGVVAVIDGKSVAAGNAKLMKRQGVPFSEAEGVAETLVYVAADQTYLGYILIADEVKEDASQAIKCLKDAGIQRTVMLTGDRKAIAQKVGGMLGVDEVYAELLPADKVAKVEALISGKSAKGQLAFVGDGINDAPVLARADIGIAMGALGSDAAIEAADVVLMTDEPSKVALAVRLSRKTLRIVKQNIVLTLFIKAAVLLLGAAGIASMWAAVFADVGVAIIAILNAVRMLRVER